MSAKTDFIADQIYDLRCLHRLNEVWEIQAKAMLAEWSRQLVIAELEEWQDGSTPGFKYDNN